MINVKSEVYEAIKDITSNVSDGYPRDWATLPAIQYTEEDNSVYEWVDGAESKAHLLYKVDIWNNGSTSEAALAVDAAISALGLRRTACGDVSDPSGLRHKVMRFEGIIDVDTEMVYQTRI
ncbi:MAG: hypothetical protein LUD50_04660 [Clostridia bacterium]|nr:hypothetical protein [Clostridia bacterium]